MPSYELQYPKQPYSTVKRYDTRASYALSTIHTIIATSPILHVSFNDPSTPFPTTLPMIGALGSFTRPSADITEVQDLYLHGYVSSRIMNLTRSGPSTQEDPGSGSSEGAPQGLPLCISATHLDGLVLSLTPNSHSYNYRSAVLYGHATPVTQAEEKVFAMRLITNGVVPGRWEGTRTPPTAAEMASTSLLRVRIAAGSAKVRCGGPGDDRHDLADDALLDRTWTGVLPVWTSVGEPVPGGYNRVREAPAYIEGWRREGNEEREREAVEAASRVMEGKKKTDEDD